jgi:hypothetical protein
MSSDTINFREPICPFGYISLIHGMLKNKFIKKPIKTHTNFKENKMKRMLIVMLLTIITLLPAALTAGSRNVSKVGEWGTGPYLDVFTQGNYAYCAAGDGGLDIIDISDPASPRIVAGCETGGDAKNVEVKGNYAYVMNTYNGLKVFDISNPADPKEIGSYDGNDLNSITISGNYLYLLSSGDYYKMQILDISNPAVPTLKGTYVPKEASDSYYNLYDVVVEGNYAYLVLDYFDFMLWEYVGRMHVIDISNPAVPQLKGSYTGLNSPRNIAIKENVAFVCDSTNGLVIVDVSDPQGPVLIDSDTDRDYNRIKINGNYAYVSFSGEGIEIFDVTDPGAPSTVAIYGADHAYSQLHVANDNVYIAANWKGLQIVGVSNPAAPAAVGAYDHSSNPTGIYVKGNYAFIVDNNIPGIRILDVSSPATPIQKSTWVPDGNEKNIVDLKVKDNLALALVSSLGLYIVDVSNPAAPQKKSLYTIDEYPTALCYNGDYVYITYLTGMDILDISDPDAPVKKGGIKLDGAQEKITVQGNYVYIAGYDEFQIIDVSNPANPSSVYRKGYFSGTPYIFVRGNYLYVNGATKCGLDIYDITNPKEPVIVTTYQVAREQDFVNDMFVDGNYAYFTNYYDGLLVVDVSDPSQPKQVGHYQSFRGLERVYVEGNYIFCTSSYTGRTKIFSFNSSPIPETALNLDKTVMNFGMVLPDTYAGPQTIRVSRQGAGTLDWVVDRGGSFFNVSPASGTNEGIITVDLIPSVLNVVGEHRGTITVSAPYANNSPQVVEVIVRVTGSQSQAVPFGAFETPLEGTTATGSIPVTGWALDDVGIQSVQIFREDGNQTLVYIGDAILVEGARPDVAQAYPTYPNNSKAGWGYMLLTNYLPGGGNGSYRLHAVATDFEGNQVTLGIKTIYCDNANAVNPFGALDTPTQGGIASGNKFINFGWVLTPLPNTIPVDGSTINVWVDGVNKGNPVYNQYREDIATLFPDNNNSSGAVGYFYLDTTQYDDGVHTIQWTATDDAGNTDGIGSRFFTIQNGANSKTTQSMEYRLQSVNSDIKTSGRSEKVNIVNTDAIPTDDYSIVRYRKGFNSETELMPTNTENNGTSIIQIEELQRVEIHLKEQAENGNASRWKLVTPLIGTTMDAEKGVFYWSPGPGFVGTYRLIFVNTDSFGNRTKKMAIVHVKPKK